MYRSAVEIEREGESYKEWSVTKCVCVNQAAKGREREEKVGKPSVDNHCEGRGRKREIVGIHPRVCVRDKTSG